MTPEQPPSETQEPAQESSQESALPEGWELVVGLEVHVELATKTKLFCGCANRFGDEPNTNICPTCLGLPGSLPVVNATAVEYAMLIGRALNCDINPSVFARKNYFYPDMPKNYQISQYDQPTNTNGHLQLPDTQTTIGIERAHIEEDTGKTSHAGTSGRIHDASAALIDYNRAGVPLVEIVTRPDIRSADQAQAFVRELQAILIAIGVSDARMEQGSMRVDANVSVRPTGSDELRTRCEIKNVNSLRSLRRSVVFEALRHIDLYNNNEAPRQETRHADEETGRTTAGRSKEEADDYRYFADPDLINLNPSDAVIKAIDDTLPPLPAQRRHQLTKAGITPDQADIVVDRNQDDLLIKAVTAGANAELTTTRIVNDLAVDDWHCITGERLAELINLEHTGTLSATQAKQVLAQMCQNDQTPQEIAAELGFEAMESDELDTLLDQIIAENPAEWQRFVTANASNTPAEDEKKGEDAKKLVGFFTGQIMRQTKGRADGAKVNQLLIQKARSTPTEIAR